MTKKLVLLIALTSFCLISCSSENDKNLNGKLNTNHIVGIWKPIKFVEVYQNGNSKTVETYSRCLENNRIIFTENGGYDREDYSEQGNGNCQEKKESSNIISGTWEKLDGNLFRLKIIYKNGNSDTSRPEVTFPNNNQMIFTWDGDVPEISYFFQEFNYVE